MPASVLAAGIATGVGSLPHRDAHDAAALVLRCLPDLPNVPQLPRRHALEGMLAQWLHGVDGVSVAPDGTLRVDGDIDPHPTIEIDFASDAHGGLVAFTDAALALDKAPARVKAQVTGPLTLGVTLTRLGVATTHAFPAAARIARDSAIALEQYFAARLPDTAVIVFFDEPALVEWRGDSPPLDRELASDLLSAALASPGCDTGVHVCGPGDVQVALAAGPDVVHLDVDAVVLEDAIALARYLDGGGWIAWGAVPTNGPIGEHPAPLWKALLDVWCELTRRGCDPVRMRQQALVAPACGLAGHGPTQAERAMVLARELGNRVHDQAAATKLAIGA
jgi:methionine synthase II (cobalamin-independent)